MRVVGALFALGSAALLLEANSLQAWGSGRFSGATTALSGAQMQQRLGARDAWIHAPENKSVVDVVPARELLHLSVLQAACLAHNTSVIPHAVGVGLDTDEDSEAQTRRLVINESDPQALQKLRECPDIDVFLPTGSRGHGYCEDAGVYVKFLETRMLTRWVFDATFFDTATNKNVTYFELCPQTPVIFFNHYWDDLTDSPAWPKQKPVYLMPNVEMYELTAEHYWRVDVVLCKTQTCYDRVTKWYAQEGNPRDAKVIYTKHTTSDVANLARHVLGTDVIRPKDYQHVNFIHTAGCKKGTHQVVQCWLSRPDFPPLDLYINAHTYKGMFSAEQDVLIRKSRNINLTDRRMDPISFGKAIAEASFFLCPSVMEGYGHYINQARASGGVIVTTDVEPMNELIPSRDFGVLVKPTEIGRDGHMLLAGAYTGEHGLKPDVVQGLSARISKAGVCAAIEQVVFNTTVWTRKAMAANVRRQYHLDTKFFALEMLKLRQFAARQRSAAKTTRNHLRQQPQQDSQQLNDLGQ
uniref:Glycosyl transferase family 1 domain-containing protein n=1 Tax=Globisporangium ultimum (strain ATCC 200006 / CBS 805.95 / DAOM BR144) TaxID=431595 RepID=K3WTC8_GLOUD